MSRHIVIGNGVAGQHHIRVLSNIGRAVSLVLDASQCGFAGAWHRALATETSDVIWHICTPTDTHMLYLQQLLQTHPTAKVIVEKPIGCPGESTIFSAVAVGSSVMVQNQYSYSHTLVALTNLMNNEKHSEFLKIEISFEKFRHTVNRFEDRQRFAIGYEGFHHFAIALRLIENMKGLDVAEDFSRTAQFKIVSNGLDGFYISLFTANIEVNLRSRLDVEQRQSKIEIFNNSGSIARLFFETNDWFTGMPRQTHLINTVDNDVIFEEDLMSTGIEACVHALTYRNTVVVARNQQRAIEIEYLLDRACEKAN